MGPADPKKLYKWLIGPNEYVETCKPNEMYAHHKVQCEQIFESM